MDTITYLAAQLDTTAAELDRCDDADCDSCQQLEHDYRRYCAALKAALAK